jgi:hypothetical protein
MADHSIHPNVSEPVRFNPDGVYISDVPLRPLSTWALDHRHLAHPLEVRPAMAPVDVSVRRVPPRRNQDGVTSKRSYAQCRVPIRWGHITESEPYAIPVGAGLPHAEDRGILRCSQRGNDMSNVERHPSMLGETRDMRSRHQRRVYGMGNRVWGRQDYRLHHGLINVVSNQRQQCLLAGLGLSRRSRDLPAVHETVTPLG